jgi:hypothetical protein
VQALASRRRCDDVGDQGRDERRRQIPLRDRRRQKSHRQKLDAYGNRPSLFTLFSLAVFLLTSFCIINPAAQKEIHQR